MMQWKDDPWFDEQEVISRMKNLWMQRIGCHAAWDVEPLQPYFSEALYQQERNAVQEDQQKDIMHMAGRPAVLDGILEPATAGADQEAMVCMMFTRYIPRVVKQGSNEVLQDSGETFFHEDWLLTRPAGTKTPKPGAPISVNCPNCGAPFSLYKTAKCPMCKSLIPVPDFTWTVEKITVREG